MPHCDLKDAAMSQAAERKQQLTIRPTGQREILTSRISVGKLTGSTFAIRFFGPTHEESSGFRNWPQKTSEIAIPCLHADSRHGEESTREVAYSPWSKPR